MYNRVIMIGRLVADPELRTTPGGDQVANYRIAVDRPTGKGKDRRTDFFSVNTWGSQAEFVCRYFAKGRLIGLEGQLRTREYTDRSDNKRMAFEIRAERQFFVGPKEQPQAAAGSPAAGAQGQGGTAVDAALPGQTGEGFEPVGDDDDLPF